MFKFKSIYTQSGCFTYNFANYIFANGSFETEDEGIAEFLRTNANFSETKGEEPEEIIASVEVENLDEVQEIKEVKESELDKLKKEALNLNLKFPPNIGASKLQEKIDLAKQGTKKSKW